MQNQNTPHTTENFNREELIALTTEILAGYVSHNQVPVENISQVINVVYQSLAKCVDAPIHNHTPAVPVNKSVTGDYIVCLEDGKKFTSLKRHLKTFHQMTPDQYRQKWHLKTDYPMVAPNYSAKRSSIAHNIGLGFARKRVRRAA